MIITIPILVILFVLVFRQVIILPLRQQNKIKSDRIFSTPEEECLKLEAVRVLRSDNSKLHEFMTKKEIVINGKKFIAVDSIINEKV